MSAGTNDAPVSDVPIVDVPAQAGLLAGKVALVLGASRGIGAATARALGRAGAKVVVASRDATALEAVARSIRDAGSDARAVTTDMLDEAQVARAVATTVEAFGRIDVAFNNAGSGHMPAPMTQLTVQDLDTSIGINLRGTFVAMKHQLLAMLAQGGGAIVNMASTAGLAGVRGMGAYVATKHGVIGISKSAALEYAAKGIRINVVAPGPILNDRIRSLSAERRAPIAQAVPMGRIGQPDEVAAAVVWLSSDAASFVTGAVLPIDGGRLAGA